MIQDKVLQQDWLVACPASEVTDTPIQIMLMGERLVMFRNDKGVHVFKDLCIHRGAALSGGHVKDGCLVCPYHAWSFDDKGDCVDIPQLPDGVPIPTKAKAITYLSKEAYGLIWVNLAGNNPPFITYAPMADSGYRNILWGPQQVTAKPPRIVENFLDVGHLAIVHEGTLGDATHRQIDNYEVHTAPDGRLYSDEIAIYQPDPDGSGQARYVYYTYEILRPCTVLFTKTDRQTQHSMTILLTIRPETEDTSVAYGIMSFDYDNGVNDQDIIAYQDAIFAEDKPIVENQKPEELPLDLQVELSLVSDRMSIAYRRYLKDLGVVLGTN